jgi:hypothetical protein
MEESWQNDQNDGSFSEVSRFWRLFSRFGLQTSLERAAHHLHANQQKYLGTTTISQETSEKAKACFCQVEPWGSLGYNPIPRDPKGSVSLGNVKRSKTY